MSENRPNPNRPWREIAEEVSTECDCDKVTELSQELIKALDQQSPTRQSATKIRSAESRLRSAMAQFASSTDWNQLYQAALLETDADKLPERIMIARSAILDKIEESFTHPLPGEHRAMDEALRGLRRLAAMSKHAA